jgi:flagellar hook-basal body protein
MKQMMGLRRLGGRTLAVLACLQGSACGGVSTDERWELDAFAVNAAELSSGCESSGAESTPAEGADAGSTAACSPLPLAGYGYAEPPSIWLGVQALGSIGVRDQGYLVALDPGSEPPLRFSRETYVFASPDGTLEDAAGRQLLGYPSDVADLRCLAPLRAPATAPATPTRRASLQMNLDVRSPLVTFDLEDPDATSNFSVSFQLFDSRGEGRTVDVYFQRVDARTWTYHGLADGSALQGGTPGEHVELGQGSLAFTDAGMLSSAFAPDLCASFTQGATPNQCVSIAFGATSFADFSSVMALALDGSPAGAAAFVGIDPSGLASVYFDNGTSAPLGALAVARFPRERNLAEQPDGTFIETPASGPPHFGVPGTAGRGVLFYSEASATP